MAVSAKAMKAWVDGVQDPPVPGQESGEIVQPERALCAAILCDALDCIVGRAHVRSPAERDYERRTALAWISEQAFDGPYSFERICQLLGLDPETVRRQVRAQGFVAVWAKWRWWVKRGQGV